VQPPVRAAFGGLAQGAGLSSRTIPRSVDTKKKELVGDSKTRGKRGVQREGPNACGSTTSSSPRKGRRSRTACTTSPGTPAGFSVGIDHDTATFAVNSIRRWWQKIGRPVYPKARSLLINADSGGSNGSRVRLWKWELQRFAAKTGLRAHRMPLPSRDEQVEQDRDRLFSYISTNWRGQPLVSLAAIVSLIASTRTKTGLRVRCELDKGRYPRAK
jgi:hypothetical protein